MTMAFLNTDGADETDEKDNFSQPAAVFGIFLRKLPRINREFFENYSCPSASVRSENKLAFSLPHRRLSSVNASITLPLAQARFTIKFTDNLRFLC